MSTYLANPTHVGAGRPPCANCGAAARLHLPSGLELREGDTVPIAGRQYVTQQGWRKLVERGLLCPEPYRPDTLEVARRELAEAEASGDEARVFVARGNLQRLEGRRREALRLDVVDGEEVSQHVARRMLQFRPSDAEGDGWCAQCGKRHPGPCLEG